MSTQNPTTHTPTGQPIGTASGADGSGYAFAASAAELIDAQLSCIQDCYDPATVSRLDEVGVTTGWRCWEVGAGAGSITRWLSERVGPTGSVLATDLDPHRVPRLGNVEVRRHDLLQDEPPGARFDLIHARLVLQHLPERHKVLAQLATALRPGGWLLLEDFDCSYLPALTRDTSHAALYDRVIATMLETMAAAGIDLAWGSRTYEGIRAVGLADVTSTTYAAACPGGTPGARLFAVNARQLQGRLLAAGLSRTDLDSFQLLLADPSFAVGSYLLTSSRGRRSTDGI